MVITNKKVNVEKLKYIYNDVTIEDIINGKTINILVHSTTNQPSIPSSNSSIF